MAIALMTRGKVKAEQGEEAALKQQEKAVVKQRQAAWAEQIRWLLNPHLRGEKLKITHPARPMVGLPDSLIEEIEILYGRKVAQA